MDFMEGAYWIRDMKKKQYNIPYICIYKIKPNAPILGMSKIIGSGEDGYGGWDDDDDNGSLSGSGENGTGGWEDLSKMGGLWEQ